MVREVWWGNRIFEFCVKIWCNSEFIDKKRNKMVKEIIRNSYSFFKFEYFNINIIDYCEIVKLYIN